MQSVVLRHHLRVVARRVDGREQEPPVEAADGDDADEHPRPNRLLGNVLAIITGVGLGAYGNAIRYTSSRHPNLPAQAAQLFSNFNAMVFCLILAACSSGARPLKVHEPQRLWWVTMLMFKRHHQPY